MKILLLVTALCLAPVVGVQAAPRSKIDARGVRLVEREIARLQSLKSFSVRGRETVYRAGQVRNSTFRASLQWPYRAALQVESGKPIDEGDGGRRRVLMGQQLFISTHGAPATTKNLGSTVERARTFVSVFRGAASLVFSFVQLSAGVNLANHPFTVSVRVVPLRDGKSVLRNVVVQLKTRKPNESLETYELGFDARGRLRRSLARLMADGKQTTIVGHYETVEGNWKGSQARTDALVYNWNIVAPGVKTLAVVPPTIVVSPEAKAIFMRAHKLYSALNGLRLRWNYRRELVQSTEQRELRYDRDGRLFLQGDFGSFHVAAIDGKTSIVYNKQLNQYAQKKLRQRGTENENIEEQFVNTGKEEADLRLQLSSDEDEGLSIVWGRDALEDIESQIRVSSVLQSLKATVLSAQPFDGEACDRVRVTVATRAEGNNVEIQQRTLWFARSDGRLMRWQNQSVSQGQTFGQTDGQVTLQEFDPVFNDNEFKFAVPQSATRRFDD